MQHSIACSSLCVKVGLLLCAVARAFVELSQASQCLSYAEIPAVA